MKLDELLKTKIGQDPRNRALLEQTLKEPLSGAVCPLPNTVGERGPVQPLEHKKKVRGGSKRSLALCITIIRFGRGELDGDNLQTGAKPLRDAIARSLGVDDNDKRITWRYAQVIGPGHRGTIITIG